MTRKALVIAVLTVIMGTHMSACSSSGGKDDTSVAESNDETFAEEGEGDFADTAQASTDAGAATTDTATTDTTTTDASGAKPDDAGADLSLAGGDAPAANGAADAGGLPADTPPGDATAPVPTDVATTDAKPADDGGLSLDSADALPADTASAAPAPVENITDNPAAPSDAGVFDAQKPADTTSVADAGTPPADTPPADTTPSEPVADATPSRSPKHSVSSGGAVSYAPLMKVKDVSFTGPGGATLNRVYIARPKDTSKSIATKIYNDPKRSKDLVKWNPVLKRGARAGDKVYYASAANPSDSKMMNFYDEAGVAPQTYVSKDGDNLRTVSKSLLGFNDAWKEVWETNASVDSKGKIPAGLSISYWPNANVAAPVQTMAATSQPGSPNGGMPTTLPDAAPQVPPQAQIPPGAQGADPFNAPPPGAAAATAQVPPGAMPPGQQVADNGQGPDPLAPPAPNAAAEQAQGAPPPVTAAGSTAPPPQENQAPPPPPVPAKPKKVAKEAAPADEGGMDADTTMALGVGGVLLLAAAILFVVIRKNRAKRMDLGQTQV